MTWYMDGRIILEDDFDDDIIGFVYCITNLETGRKYVGKKGLFKSKTYQKNKRRRRKQVASDWMSYYGSCEELKEDIKRLGKSSFRREVLHLCRSKSELNLVELYEQVHRDVLRKPDEYYNQFIGTRINRKQLAKHIESLRNQTDEVK